MEQTVKVNFDNAPSKAEMLCSKVDYILDDNANITKDMMGSSLKLELRKYEQDLIHKDCIIKIQNEQIELADTRYDELLEKYNEARSELLAEIKENSELKEMSNEEFLKKDWNIFNDFNGGNK